jgi:hypothetical protein
MTMKKIIALGVLLLCSAHAQAGPIDWTKRQFRDHPIRTRVVTTVVAGVVYEEGLRRCRIPNVENCQGHYGAAWGEYGTTMALDVVGQIVGYKLGGKVGDSISYGSNLGIIGWGAYQWHGGLNKPAEDNWTETSHVDLSHVVILHH